MWCIRYTGELSVTIFIWHAIRLNVPLRLLRSFFCCLTSDERIWILMANMAKSTIPGAQIKEHFGGNCINTGRCEYFTCNWSTGILVRIPCTLWHSRLHLRWDGGWLSWANKWLSQESNIWLKKNEDRLRVRRKSGERHLPKCIFLWCCVLAFGKGNFTSTILLNSFCYHSSKRKATSYSSSIMFAYILSKIHNRFFKMFKKLHWLIRLLDQPAHEIYVTWHKYSGFTQSAHRQL